MKPTLIGFNGVKPHAIILWYKGEQATSKTICYDEQELQQALARHNTPGDFYNTLEPSIHLMEVEKGELTA